MADSFRRTISLKSVASFKKDTEAGKKQATWMGVSPCLHDEVRYSRNQCIFIKNSLALVSISFFDCWHLRSATSAIV